MQQLIAQRQQALDALDSFAADTLAQGRQQLQEHLAFIDRDELAQRALNDPVRTALLKRLHGIEKKIEGLNEMTRHHIDLEMSLLTTARERVPRRMNRFQCPK